MQVITTRNELVTTVDNLKKSNKIIGFVPTMGALHEGHLSLVTESNKACDVTIASIFVNPTQFNDPSDLERYPRTPEQDMNLLEQAGCDIVFCPSVEEIYPEKDTRQFEFGYIEQVMEGAKRPGHFNGVAQVVSKLFDVVRPDKAFFGMKDFQQVAIINAMVKQLRLPVEIVPCPIIRENDGLAMSSRNMLLTPEHREAAPIISKTLFAAKEKKNELDPVTLKTWIETQINNCPLLEVEYVDIVDDTTLEPIQNWNDLQRSVICIAVFAGKIRLIDNIAI